MMGDQTTLVLLKSNIPDVKIITQDFNFGSPNFQGGFDIALSQMVL